MAKDEYISSKTQSCTTEATLPSGEKVSWLRTVTQTWGWALASVGAAKAMSAPIRAAEPHLARLANANVNSRSIRIEGLACRRPRLAAKCGVTMAG